MVLVLAGLGSMLSFSLTRTGIRYGYYFYLFLYADTDEVINEEGE